MLESLRYLVFWLVDGVKGSHYKKNYDDVKFLNENYTDFKSINKRNEYLKSVLKLAVSSTNYYKNINSEADLNQFPVIDKNVIRENFSDFQSTAFMDRNNYKVSTSGSTGTPFTTYLDANKKTRNSTDTIYFAEKSGFKLGQKLIYVRLWDEQHTKSKLSSWVQNIFSHDITKLSDKDISTLLDKLQNDTSIKGFLAYASAYDAICQYLDRIGSDPLSCNVVSIIAISERLSDYAKQRMKYYFGCSVVSRYSASETGIIAQQEIDEDYFKVNWGSYVVEILKLDSDDSAEEGELGRIVITDLFNYAVPMIRYDTGDLGILGYVDNCDEPVLKQVEGRKMDMLYDTQGHLITSHIVHQICLFKGIKQYQLVQDSKVSYTFKINVSSDFKDEKELVDKYKDLLGIDAILNVEYVDEIPLLSSGKRKKVVNNFYK